MNSRFMNTGLRNKFFSLLLLTALAYGTSACDSGEVRTERKKLEQERADFAAEKARAQLAADEKALDTRRELREVGLRAAELVSTKAALERTTEDAKQQVAALALEKTGVEKTSADAQSQANALNTAIDASKQYQQQQIDRAKRARAFSEGFMAAQQAKLSVGEYFQAEGKWPTSNKELGLPTAESYRTETLRSLNVEPAAKAVRIRVKFVNQSGVEQQLLMVAETSEAGQITWTCRSPDVKDIQEIMPTCRYQAG